MKEKDIIKPNTNKYHFKLAFVHNDPTQVSFYVNGILMWTNQLGRPISKETYDGGGLSVKACIDLQDVNKTAAFTDIKISDIKVCTDKRGTKWIPISQVETTQGIKTPAPNHKSWNPLIGSYKEAIFIK